MFDQQKAILFRLAMQQKEKGTYREKYYYIGIDNMAYNSNIQRKKRYCIVPINPHADIGTTYQTKRNLMLAIHLSKMNVPEFIVDYEQNFTKRYPAVYSYQ